MYGNNWGNGSHVDGLVGYCGFSNSHLFSWRYLYRLGIRKYPCIWTYKQVQRLINFQYFPQKNLHRYTAIPPSNHPLTNCERPNWKYAEFGVGKCSWKIWKFITAWDEIFLAYSVLCSLECIYESFQTIPFIQDNEYVRETMIHYSAITICLVLSALRC